MNDIASETYEAGYIDYTEQIEDISTRLEELTESTTVIQENVRYLEYMPHIYNNTALLLGLLIVCILFRGLIQFLSHVFGDTTKL